MTTAEAGGDERAGGASEAAEVLRAHPQARVAAINLEGFFVPMPASVPLLASQRAIEGHSSTLDLVITDDVRAVVDAWQHARRYGRGQAEVHPRGAPDVVMTVHYFDTQDAYECWLGVVVGPGAEHISETGSEVEALRPRLTVARQDELGNYLWVDDAMELILGHPDLAGRPALDLLHPDDVGQSVDVWMDMLSKPGCVRRMRNRMRHVDGHWVWFEVTLRNLLHDPAHQCVLAELIDISDELAAQVHLAAQETLLRRLTDSLPVGVVQVDLAGHIVHCNPQAGELFGHPDAATLSELVADVAEPGDAVLAGAIERARTEIDSDVEISVVRSISDIRRCQVQLRALPDPAGGASGFILCVSDVTEPARLRDQLRHQATYDPLTGCHNRASTLVELQRQLTTGGVGGHGIGVMFIDLDGFKSVNDRRGHAAGDELLTDLGRVLGGAVRDGDVVGRIGGDEFLVVFSKATSAEQVVALAERVAAKLASSFDPEPPHAAVASIGVAWTPGTQADLDAAELLISRADTAMYRSKAAGDGRPVLWQLELVAYLG